MNKKAEQNFVVMMLAGIIFILISLAFITTVANTRSTQTQLMSVSDEQTNLQTNGCYTGDGQVNESNSACNITVDNWYSTGDWRLSESQCYLKSVSVTNDTGTALTSGTDYVLYEDEGIIQMLNTTTTANSSDTMSNGIVEIDYSYCGEGYLTSSGDRGLANLWTTLMIIVVIGVLAGAVASRFRGK